MKKSHQSIFLVPQFGGNPVSMAIAEAVLTVIEEEDLQSNSQKMGTFLLEGLTALKEKHEAIGDVRGVGLFIGVDIVKDKESKKPDKELASLIKMRYVVREVFNL